MRITPFSWILFICLEIGWVGASFGAESEGQYTPLTITTPVGSPVQIFVNITPQMTEQQRIDSIVKYHSRFPDAILIGDPTVSYNCHGYGLAMLSGRLAWLNPDQASTYYHDGTLHWMDSGGPFPSAWTVNTLQSYPIARLRHGPLPDDHTSTFSFSPLSDRHLVSKWASNGLYRHNFTDFPYYQWWEAFHR